MGIESYGGGATIEGNSVYDTFGVGTGEGVGLSVSDYGVGTVVRNNHLQNFSTTSGTGNATMGIWIGSANSNIIVDNHTVTVNKTAGIRFGGTGTSAVVTNNLISVNSTASGIWFNSSTTAIYNTTLGATTKYRIDSGTTVTTAATNY
jgi:hypothetical protein